MMKVCLDVRFCVSVFLLGYFISNFGMRGISSGNNRYCLLLFWTYTDKFDRAIGKLF